MPSDEEISDWIQRLAEGDSRSAEVIWEQYFDQLVQLARRRMSGMPLRVVDEEDVALSAMKSFVRGAQEGRFPKLRDRNGLWKLLVTITARKAIAQYRRHMAEKNGGGNVRGDSAFAFGRPEESFQGIGQVMGPEPTPEFEVMMSETCAAMIDSLDDDSLREVALKKLDGFTNKEIAEAMGRTVRMVEIKLNRVRSIWSREEVT